MDNMEGLDVELLSKHLFGYFSCVEKAKLSIVCKKWHTSIYDPTFIPNPKKCTTCNEAATHGHLQCLQYAHENGRPWDKWTTARAYFKHCRYPTLDAFSVVHSSQGHPFS